MEQRLSRELRAFEQLAGAAAADPADAASLLERTCSEVRAAFDLARADVLAPDRPAAGHPLVERALRERRAVTDGRRVAAPLLVEDRCHGFLIGDDDGLPLDLDDADLRLLTALVAVVAVLVDDARALGRLERSLDARTDFVSLASHELRTPIAVVHGVVATLHLRGETLPHDQLRELHATAYDQTSRLAQLAEQLLDLSRIESRTVPVRPERLRPRELVEALVRRIAPDRAVDVSVEIDPRLELEADASALERVLGNLILNALRYGEPPVRVRAAAGARPRLLVEDAGSVDPAFVPRLFERFTRGHGVGPGAGLGLAIARSYAEALGGGLEYERLEPRGSRFALRLPLGAVRGATRA